MTERDPGAARVRVRLVPSAIAIPVAAAIAFGVANRGCDREPAPLAPASTLELARADLPSDGPVRVRLALPVPSTDAKPRPVRLFSLTDQRGLQLQGRLDDARSVVTIEIDPAWLLPGTYFVEVQTTEPSPFPLRRYAIVVR